MMMGFSLVILATPALATALVFAEKHFGNTDSVAGASVSGRITGQSGLVKKVEGTTDDNGKASIEIRRHDAPNFIKEFQTELLYTLFDCKDSAEVLSKGYENALLLVTRTIDKVMTGEIQIKDLVVSKLLRQDLTKYRSLFPHVSAALQLTEAGNSLVRGDIIQYIYTDADHVNPLRRVMPLDLISEEHDYDKEKYRETLLVAAESILGYFGFDRTVYGDRKKNKKWWYELRDERRKDIEIERDVHDG